MKNLKPFLWYFVGALCFASFGYAQVEFPTTQPGPPNQSSVWVQGGIGSNVRTYRLSAAASTWATSGEFFQMSGSATKTIRIQKVLIGGAATAAVGTPVIIKRESSAISGGTCAAQAANISTMDTGNAAATVGAISLCTAAPTVGTAVNVIDNCRLNVQTVASGQPDICAFSFGTNNDQPLRLTGTGDFMGIQNTTSFGTAGVLDITVEWTEEP